MFSLCKQVHTGSPIEHTLYCNFLSAEEKHIIVAGGSRLTAYKILNQENDKKPGQSSKPKLEYEASFDLHENISSMSYATLPAFQRDILLITFPEAKLVILEFDTSTSDLRTLSMFEFEDDDLKCGKLDNNMYIPIVKIDPDMRCAAVLIYGCRLAILPFRRDAVNIVDNVQITKSPVLSPYIIDVSKFDEPIPRVVDFAFLFGYYESTILILHEPHPTWAGRIAMRKDTRCIAAISLNLMQKVNPVIWSMPGLPFDSRYLHPIEKPIGGVLLFAHNSLLYLNQSFPPFGVSLNCITQISTEFSLKVQRGVKMSLDCSNLAMLTNDTMAVSLSEGEIYILKINIDSMRAVKSFTIEKCASSVIATCICKLDNDLLFLGSRLGNSILLSYSTTQPDSSTDDEATLIASESATGASTDGVGGIVGGDGVDTKKEIDTNCQAVVVKKSFMDDEEGLTDDSLMDSDSDGECGAAEGKRGSGGGGAGAGDGDGTTQEKSSVQRDDMPTGAGDALDGDSVAGGEGGERGGGEGDGLTDDDSLMDSEGGGGSGIDSLDEVENKEEPAKSNNDEEEENQLSDDSLNSLSGHSPVAELEDGQATHGKPVGAVGMKKDDLGKSDDSLLDSDEDSLGSGSGGTDAAGRGGVAGDEANKANEGNDRVEEPSQTEQLTLESEASQPERTGEFAQSSGGDTCGSSGSGVVDADVAVVGENAIAGETTPTSVVVEAQPDLKTCPTTETTEIDTTPVSQPTSGQEGAKRECEPDLEYEPASKLKKTEDINDWIATDVNELEDLEELEVYGTTVNYEEEGIKKYTFEVCDSILNIGPCGKMVMGEPAFLSEEYKDMEDRDLELMTTSGFKKNGALSILQRSIRPQTIATFEMEDIFNVWTAKKNPKDESDHDNYLILSKDTSTQILETSDDISELDKTAFNRDNRTLKIANFGDDGYIIQVCRQDVFLVKNDARVATFEIDELCGGGGVSSCDICYPYVGLVSSLGVHFALLTLKFDVADYDELDDLEPAVTPRFQVVPTVLRSCHSPQSDLETTVTPIPVDSAQTVPGSPSAPSSPAPCGPAPFVTASFVTAMCLYRDVSGRLSSLCTAPPEYARKIAEDESATTTSGQHQDGVESDDEDAMLYGDSDTAKFFDNQKTNETSTNHTFYDNLNVEPTLWAVICRKDGSLEIYSIIQDEFILKFHASNFCDAPQVLEHNAESKCDPRICTQIEEILVLGCGYKKSKPFLFARPANGDFMIYKLFPFCLKEDVQNEFLKIRFKKIHHNMVLNSNEDRMFECNTIDTRRLMFPFTNIAGYKGVFIAGPNPYWVIITDRCKPRFHAFNIDGPILYFSPFNNKSCPNGFLTYNKNNQLRISVLPTHLLYDSEWPTRKVPLRCSPLYVVYHPGSKTYTVVTSSPEECTQFVKVAPEGEKDFETLKRDQRFIYPSMDRFKIELFSPVSWEPIPNTQMHLEDFERVSCVKNVNLIYEGAATGVKGFIAAGTCENYNEDVTSRGKIIIYDIIEVVPEPGQPLSKNKVKVVYHQEQKGPVTAIDHVDGLLITAIGQKIYLWQLTEEMLSGIAFIDTQIYIHTICIVKNLILIGDLHRSITLLRYQSKQRVLSQVSKDKRNLEIFSCAFIIQNKQLAFLTSDINKNIMIYDYNPDVRECRGGSVLRRISDFNLCSCVPTFFRIQCKKHIDFTTKDNLNRHATYFATTNGDIGFVLPVIESTFRRLNMLENSMAYTMQHTAGMNPRTARTMKHKNMKTLNVQRNILDGQYLFQYLNLSISKKNHLAKRIGTSYDQILNDLIEIQRITQHF